MTKSTKNGTSLQNQKVHTLPVPESPLPPSPSFIAEALTYLHRDGILILSNAISPTHIDSLHSLLAPEALQISKNPNHHFNWNRGNMDQAPPLQPDLMYTDIWANPIVVSILQQILGPDLVCHYANGNTALPQSTERQPVHSDIDQPHPMFPFGYAVNIPLCDVDVENGSTEIWVGSHRDSCIDQHVRYRDGEFDLAIRPELVEERRRHSPPIQPEIKKGSIIVRDVRLWHAGMPNRSLEPRIMLAFVIQPKWFQAPSKVLIPLKAKSLVERWKKEVGLEYKVEWVNGDVDHKLVSSDEVDFSTRNEKLLELQHLMRP